MAVTRFRVPLSIANSWVPSRAGAAATPLKNRIPACSRQDRNGTCAPSSSSSRWPPSPATTTEPVPHGATVKPEPNTFASPVWIQARLGPAG